MKELKMTFNGKNLGVVVKKLLDKSLLETDHQGIYWLNPLIKESLCRNYKTLGMNQELMNSEYTEISNINKKYLFDQRKEKTKANESVETKQHSTIEENYVARTIQKCFEYDVALSFSGENRKIVECIANKLKEKNVSVFYDKFEQNKLWGQKLSDYFKKTYGKNTRFVLPFISKEYSLKDWTNFEFTIARDESKRRETEFILPIRLDNTIIIGLHNDISYLDFEKEGIDGIVSAIMFKLSLKD